MKDKPQLFCGECGATVSTKFCTKQKDKPGRIERIGTNSAQNSEPIEFCILRLQYLSARRSKREKN